MLNIIARKYCTPVILHSNILYHKPMYFRHKSIQDIFRKQKTPESTKYPQLKPSTGIKHDLPHPTGLHLQKDFIQKHNSTNNQSLENDKEFEQGSGMMDEQWFGGHRDISELQEDQQEKIDSLFNQSSPYKQRVIKFARNVTQNEVFKKSTQFSDIIGCLLEENQYNQLYQLFKNYSKEGEGISDKLTRVTPKEKELFRNIRKLFCKCIQDENSVEEIMLLFSKCGPRFIKIFFSKEQKKINHPLYTFKPSRTELAESTTKYEDYLHEKQQFFSNEKKVSDKISNVIETFEKDHKFNSNDVMGLIQSLDDQGQSRSKKKRHPKLRLKRQENKADFQADETTLQKVQKKLFGNKKIISEQMIIKRVGRNTDKQANNFGDNWVYCYDLPYDIRNESAEDILSIIESQYGGIESSQIFPYINILQRKNTSRTFILPEQFESDSKKTRCKIEYRENSQEKLAQPKKKSLTTKILEKTKKTKDLKLDKSYMLIKFKRKQDKIKFLSPQMRLFGLNTSSLKNVKFEDAKAKNMIALSMVPWGYESQNMIKAINENLLPLSISLTHPNCIIAKKYIFIELANFYEAYYSQNLLNNMVFQNQQLKCELIYGSAQIIEGQFKHNLETDHYQNLVQKLSNLRGFYEELYL